MRDDLAYQTGILEGVSRTFALTIPQLPAPLRDVVGNAYLLCRIADTIEDEPTLSVAQKQAFGALFVEVVAGGRTADRFARELRPLLSSAMLDSEHGLVANTARVIRITHGFRAVQRNALERCVSVMSRGMLANALRFTLLIPSHETGIRRFCLWALGMAVLTLRRVHARPTFTDSRQVRISRRSVRATVVVTNSLARSDLALRMLFHAFTRGLPSPGPGSGAASS